MIILDRKERISALKLIHTLNRTQINRFCDIHNDHVNLIKTLDYTIGESIYDLHAGLYKVIINNIEYIIYNYNVENNITCKYNFINSNLY